MNPFQPLSVWFSHFGRKLPWRESREPYIIWISEIILQQTRVAQGLNYFLQFLSAFPDVHTLAKATPDQVLKKWEGLGYYSRARNLHATSKIISGELKGKFPETVEDLLKLKGIGPYTSRAIASICFGVDAAVIDGNVFRVLSRYLADPSPIDLPATRKKFQEILDSWVKGKDASLFNQAMMDLGATLCLPKNPNCKDCPLAAKCLGLKRGTMRELPIKSKKNKRGEKYFRFYLIIRSGKILIRQRPPKGLWAGLWEIPNEEISFAEWKKTRKLKLHEYLGEFSHAFTHFEMKGKLFLRKGKPSDEKAGVFITREKIHIFAFPKAVLNLFERFFS